MEIKIEDLAMEDAEALFQFELVNRSFFSSQVPDRGDDFFVYGNFLKRLALLLKEQEEGTSRFFLIKDTSGEILGRINIADVDKNRVGELGYRVGEIAAGKGVAGKAVRMLIEKVSADGKIKGLTAKTTRNNIPSRKVLDKNGFKLERVEEAGAVYKGEKLDFFHYRLIF
ncbi:GNAT family N-acetyltransferase [Evansella sp. LMS18]|uniref:GNAT family N-acetyltransferase n=1 Tax=Evansella sp. LMS18 TaxID=2924033 RepID=UPI0020D0AEEF|nr:GNAT family protein [Evansella sp. LMS18]UTR08878.1 GNAT family N-acetyltransferase [Evansella sp. LMS18]